MTNFRLELEQTALFLQETKGIWEQEVLNNYPETLCFYPQAWSDYLSTLSDDEQMAFECRHFDGLTLPAEISELFEKLSSLERIPTMAATENIQISDYPSWAFVGVTGKKQHEISCITTLIDQIALNKDSKILDIGGGVGHLARTLALYHGKKVTTLDRDQDLQDKGKKRLTKFPHPEGAGEIHFSCHEFGGTDDKLAPLFNEHELALGLHTCGPLALTHLKLAVDHPHLQVINFGCCYQKLETSSDILLSKVAKEKGVSLGKHSLTLASRGHHHISEDDFKLKKRVKLYRAALHFLLQEVYGHEKFVTLGSSFPRIYRGPFHGYAKEKLNELGLKTISDSELDSFYERENIQEKIIQVYYRNMMRWHFARLIEKYILLDRALWLEEQGKKVEMLQVFSPTLSPRNVALIVS